MGIDQGEEGDAPTRLPARIADVAAASPLDAGERAAVHARYRASVDETYATARDAWAQALPGLNSAWEEHVERYPERARPTPRTQPDGSWVADGGRKLTPEQNAEASKACADIREEGVRVILNARDPATLDRTAQEIRAHLTTQVVPVAADATTAEGRAALLAGGVRGAPLRVPRPLPRVRRPTRAGAARA